MTDDDFDQLCEDMRTRAIEIRQQVERVIEQRPPRHELEAMRADLHRSTLQLRGVLREGTRQ
jgi:Tfp pilus assembly protein PilO